MKSISIGGASVVTKNGLEKVTLNKEVTVLGNNSKAIKVSSAPTTYNFSGRGYGHGVGMSQQGAKGMAMAGFTYDEILKHYFTGITIQ